MAATNGCPSIPLSLQDPAFHWMNSWSWFTPGRAVTTTEEGLRDVSTCSNANFMTAFSVKDPHIAGMKFLRYVSRFGVMGHAFLAPDVFRILGQPGFLEKWFVDVSGYR